MTATDNDLNALANDMLANGLFGNAKEVVRFFERPDRYAAELAHVNNKPHDCSHCLYCLAGLGLEDAQLAMPGVTP